MAATAAVVGMAAGAAASSNRNSQPQTVIIKVTYSWLFYLRQRSCGKVMFLHLSVIVSTAGGCLPPPWADTPLSRDPWADTPSADTPPGRPPLGRHPPGKHPPEQTPPGQIPPGQIPPGQTPPPAQCILGYGQQAGGTHPTGTHSCYVY